MIEMTFDQPLATLAVEGVVTVLVVPEPPKCPECRGLGVVGWRVNVGSALVPVMSHPMCLRCVGDGLARWPGEVTIRSSDEEPWVNDEGRGPGPGPFRTARTGTRLVRPDGPFYLTDMRDGNRIPLPLGEVVGTVAVEAAVPILGVDDASPTSFGWVTVFHRSAYLLLQSESGEHRHSDISGQLAFQDFPVGNTALILTPTDEMETE